MIINQKVGLSLIIKIKLVINTFFWQLLFL